MLPYLAGAGAFAGVGIALDQEIHADIKAGDWAGLFNHSSYHLPLLGSGHRAWDAWHAGKPWSAAGHAGLFGVEVLGLRGAGKVRGGGVKVAGRVVTKEETIKLNNSQQKAIRSLKKQIAEHRQKLEDYIADPDKYDHRGFLKVEGKNHTNTREQPKMSDRHI